MHPDTFAGLIIFGPFLMAAGLAAFAIDYFKMKGE